MGVQFLFLFVLHAAAGAGGQGVCVCMCVCLFHPNVSGYNLQFLSVIGKEWNGYFACMTSKDSGGPCWPSLHPGSSPQHCHSGVKWGTVLALNHARGPRLQPEGTCTVIWETLCSGIIHQFPWGWQLEANQVGIANEVWNNLCIRQES